MNNLSGTEPPLIRWAGKMGTFLGLSVVWLLCCLPVLTIIPACVSLYDCVVNCVHGDDPSPYRRFFSDLKSELLRGICLSLLWVGVVLLFVYGFGILNQLGKTNSVMYVYSMIYAGSMLIPLTMLAWVIPVQARFQYSFFQLHRTALSYVILHLPATAAIVGMLLVAVAIIFVLPPLLILIPAILVTLQSVVIEKVLKQYEEEEEM